MNKNKILSGGGKNLTGGGKWGWRGREVGGEGEGSGVKGGGKWGLGTPLSTPSINCMQMNRPRNVLNCTFAISTWPLFKSKKEGKDQESINQAPHLTKDTNGKVTTSQ